MDGGGAAVTHLTGPPRINGILLPRPSLGAAMELVWQPEHITKAMRSGARRRVETRYRARLAFGWDYLYPDTAHVVLTELLDGSTVQIVPRTKAAGDPAWAEEVTLEMEVISELPTIQQLLTRTVPLRLELETVATFPRPLGLLSTGGYTATALTNNETDGGLDVEPDGAATMEDGDVFALDFMGETFDLPTVQLGTEGIADTHLTPSTIEGAEHLLTRDIP